MLASNAMVILTITVNSIQEQNNWKQDISNIDELVYTLQRDYNIDIVGNEYVTPQLLHVIADEVELWEKRKKALNNE